MSNLLGSSMELQTTFSFFTFNENQFVGEDGYTRNVISTARTGLTSTGFTNYKQNNLSYPQHEFQLKVVLPRQEALDLIANIEYTLLEFSRQNNNRGVFNPFILVDNKLAIIPEALPPSYPRRFGGTGWVFTNWPIIITNYKSEYFGPNYNLFTIRAEQSF